MQPIETQRARHTLGRPPGRAVGCLVGIGVQPCALLCRAQTPWPPQRMHAVAAKVVKQSHQLFEQLCFFGVELVIGQDALGLEIAQFFECGHDVIGFEHRCSGRSCLRVRGIGLT